MAESTPRRDPIPVAFPTAKQIVAQLDRHIVGQDAAKKAVAIALRNRWRRQVLDDPISDEIYPNNIILIGPTGVGKTEIARRLATLAQAPFIKVESSRFTEVGYVGRDVESMVRDLVEIAVNMVKQEKMTQVAQKARQFAEERILDLLLPAATPVSQTGDVVPPESAATREKLRARLRAGELDERLVEVETTRSNMPLIEVFSQSGMDDLSFAIEEALGTRLPKRRKKRKMPVREAMAHLENEEIEKLIDMDEVTGEAKRRAQNTGIVFIDEIDKIAGSGATSGPDVSREGVQRDLLPIVEGASVVTKYGVVKTDHILFIAAGAFHSKKPSDLIPELQGRFPIRVELSALGQDDFRRILVEPENSLIRQYRALLGTEGVVLEFTDSGISAIAGIAANVNENTENIGARRLHTVMTKLLEELLYEAPNVTPSKIVIDEKYVRDRLDPIVKNLDVSRYIL